MINYDTNKALFAEGFTVFGSLISASYRGLGQAPTATHGTLRRRH
jgi:hypothetical protein